MKQAEPGNSLDVNYKEDLKKQGIEFPKVLPPEEKEYDLGDLTGLYKYTLERICSREKINPNTYVDADVESDENVLKQTKLQYLTSMITEKLLLNNAEKQYICSSEKTLTAT